MKVGRNFGCDLGSRTKRSEAKRCEAMARECGAAQWRWRKCENASHAVGDMSMFHQYQMIFG